MSLKEFCELNNLKYDTVKSWKARGILKRKLAEHNLVFFIGEKTPPLEFKEPESQKFPCLILDEAELDEEGHLIVRVGDVTTAICHGCQEAVLEHICLCLNCVGKGITHKSLNLDINLCQPEDEVEIPLWKQRGFKSKEEAFELVMSFLIENKSLKGSDIMFGDATIKAGSAN